MSESEALRYRTNLVRENYGELSPKQRHDLMYHPSRTQNELDSAVSDYRTKFREQQARDAAAALETRRRIRAQAELRERLTSAGGVDDGSGDPVGSSTGGAAGASGSSESSRATGGGLPTAPPEGTLGESESGEGR